MATGSVAVIRDHGVEGSIEGANGHDDFADGFSVRVFVSENAGRGSQWVECEDGDESHGLNAIIWVLFSIAYSGLCDSLRVNLLREDLLPVGGRYLHSFRCLRCQILSHRGFTAHLRLNHLSNY